MAPAETPSDRTPFQQAVYEVLTNTSPGDVLSYGEVAAEAGYPGAARAVGNALKNIGKDTGKDTVANNVVFGVPWWRVVTANGRLIPHDAKRQAQLLKSEGVELPLKPEPRL